MLLSLTVLKHCLRQLNVVGMGFHSSPLREFAKKTGSTAHEPKFRPLSKKQIKRKKAAIVKRAAVVDVKKQKIRNEVLSKQFGGVDVMEQFHSANNKYVRPFIVHIRC